MKIIWEVRDGYVGGGRVHETIIDDRDLAACSSEQEREDLIADLVQEDFRDKVSWTERSREE